MTGKRMTETDRERPVDVMEEPPHIHHVEGTLIVVHPGAVVEVFPLEGKNGEVALGVSVLVDLHHVPQHT